MLKKISLFICLTILPISMTALTAFCTTKTNAADIRQHPHSWSAKVSLATKVTLEVDHCTFTFQGDSTDQGQIRIFISDREKPLFYRYWPDISKWGLSEEDKALYSKEFKDIPGWQEQELHLSVDVFKTCRQVWLHDCLLWEWQVSEENSPRIILNGSLEKDIFAHPGQTKRFLEIPLEHYFNNNTDSPFKPNAAIKLERAQLRYNSDTAAPHNLDLGQVAYREEHLKPGPFQRLSLPYLNCDAMSSDPKRAIFRVPTRFYDRLHLLCYSDNDKNDIPRAAIRFMKSERARFLTQEFGIVPERNVHVLETIQIGTKKAKHVAVDLNPAAWQEFLTQPENEYLEFELTQPVTMDNNSFERPNGPQSSLHVLALALEQAPISMILTSDVAGHLFEDRTTAIINIHLESFSDQQRTGSLDISITRPDGQIQHEQRKFQLPAQSKKILPVTLDNIPVGKSDFTVQLSVTDESGREHIMQRQTSFAILPKFDRTDKNSPFGMWTFFEGHHGADIRTTCDVLRKAGVRGTLANFILDTNPEKWQENARRTAILNEYGIKPNWGHLAGVHNTGLKGVKDMDAQFAWMKAHPQVEYYNLFWETPITGLPTTTCPPEIREGTPITWNSESQEQINTYKEFGITWATRTRQEAPEKRISFGNGFPLFTSEMLRAGFPHEYIDGFGLDFDLYTAAPEDQPSMWYAPFSGIFYLRELRKLYNCENIPIWLTEAIYCPTSHIWITEREQADYYVRAHLLALAMGVKKFGMCAEPIDPDGWYHYSHYGPVGLCHATPEMNPRQAFSAYAAMTGILDNARFDQIVHLDSPHVFCLRFRKADNTFIHAFWTVNGSRRLDLQMKANEELTAYNRDGKVINNEISTGNGALSLLLDESPQYLVGPNHFDILQLKETDPVPAPKNTIKLVQFDSLHDWHVQTEPLTGYESINPATPLAWANLDLSIKNKSLHIRLPKANQTHPLETICMTLKYTGQSLLIPETAEAIGVRAKGNRSWGRVVFILQDKNGDQWVSARSQTPIDVDGEIYLETQLPKAPSHNQAGYKGYRSWQRDNNDLVPEYPPAAHPPAPRNPHLPTPFTAPNWCRFQKTGL